jgi:hypothetical protein
MLALVAGIPLSRHIETSCTRRVVESLGSVQDFIGEVGLALPAVVRSWDIVLRDNTNTAMCLLYLLVKTSKFSRVVPHSHDKERATQEQGT